MIDLPRLARAQGRRRDITLRPIVPTAAMATDLAAIYAPAWQVWRDAMDSILAGYDPPPLVTGDTLTTDSPAQVEASIATTAAEFLRRLVTDITPGLKRWTVRSELWHRDKWITAVRAGTGVDLSTVLSVFGTEDTLAAFIARNVALAKNVSDQAQARISDAVWRGYQNRTPVREVAKEIRETVGMARDRSVRIAADQNNKLSAALDMERQAEAGIELVKWRSSHKLHARPHHAARDGKIFELKTRKPREGGQAIPADDWVGQPPFCGCRAQAYLAIMDEIA